MIHHEATKTTKETKKSSFVFFVSFLFSGRTIPAAHTEVSLHIGDPRE